MPSLPFLPRKKDNDKDSDSVQADTEDVIPPPAYGDTSQHDEVSLALPSGPPPRADHIDITAAFSNLSLDPSPKDPTVDTCLAHLKLLHAVQSMKEDVGYTDGLWGMWDRRAESDGDIDLDDVEEAASAGVAQPATEKTKKTPDDERKIRLSKIREKRWALFVARAVDRYEAWWATFPKVVLREHDMVQDSGSVYHDFVSPNEFMNWNETMLPPLDVLMV